MVSPIILQSLNSISFGMFSLTLIKSQTKSSFKSTLPSDISQFIFTHSETSRKSWRSLRKNLSLQPQSSPTWLSSEQSSLSTMAFMALKLRDVFPYLQLACFWLICFLTKNDEIFSSLSSVT